MTATEARWSVETVVAPVGTAVSLVEAKRYLRVDHDEEDDLILSLVAAAEGAVERVTGRALVTQTLDARMSVVDACCGLTPLPRAPVASVDEVAFTDEDGNEQVLATEAYRAGLHADPATFVLTGETQDISTTNATPVRIRFTAGYGPPGSAPRALTTAVLMLTAQFYEVRGTETAGSGGVPQAAAYLTEPYSIYRL